MIQSLAPHVIHDTPRGFKVTKEWTHQFLKLYINWNFRVGNTIASIMPMDWMEQRKFMVYCVAYCAKIYNIPPHLLVNID